MSHRKIQIFIKNQEIDVTNFQLLPKKLQVRIQKFGTSILCPVCHKALTLLDLKQGKYYCSKQCRNQSEQLKQTTKQTNLNRDYSKCNMFFNSSKNRKYVQQIIQQKYHVNNIFELPEIQQKLKSYTLANPDIQKKCQAAFQQKYKVDFPLQSKEILTKKLNTDKQNNQSLFNNEYKSYMTVSNLPYVQLLDEYAGEHKKYHWKCKLCGNIFEAIYDNGKLNSKCDCQKLHNTSLLQQELYQFCCQYFSNIIQNTRKIIYPYQLDLYIPEKQIALEFNGSYWHDIEHKLKFYHLNKSLKCTEKRIRLIHIWQNDWTDQNELIKQKLISVFTNTQKITAKIDFSWNNLVTGKFSQPEIIDRNGFQVENCGWVQIQ